ncbi:hypothetical protein ACIHCV_35515 [Streptomyces sp. NPDC051956]|uniref:hypothetical protein n=1 Tax=Streptomyces sp. NPDC051956 TaxID=3365677 RepID=UPI0037D4EFC6
MRGPLEQRRPHLALQAYLGMGLPAILLSVIIRHSSVEADDERTMTGFAVALSVGAVAAVRAAMRLTDQRPGAARRW